MAYSFGASPANRVHRSASIISNLDSRPITVAFRLKQVTTTDRAFGLSQWIWENNFDPDDPRLGVAIGGGATNTLRWYTNAAYLSSATYTPDTNWHSYALTFATGTPGAVSFWRDGVNITGGTTTGTFGGGLTTTGSAIGAMQTTGGSTQSGASFNIDGSLGEFSVWNVILDAAELAAWGLGAVGRLIRPASLRAYMPFNNGVAQDLYLGNWTAPGTNTKQADHPRILMPCGPILYPPRPAAAAPPAATSYPPYPPITPAVMHMLMR